MAQKSFLIARLLRLGEPHAGMHDEVRDAGDGVVPAEILEIQETQSPVRTAQSVVRAEIGWDQGPAFRRDLRREIEAQPLISLAGLRFEAVKRRHEYVVEKGKLRDVVFDSLEPAAALDLEMIRRPERQASEASPISVLACVDGLST
jgi:hypothetical protein